MNNYSYQLDRQAIVTKYQPTGNMDDDSWLEPLIYQRVKIDLNIKYFESQGFRFINREEIVKFIIKNPCVTSALFDFNINTQSDFVVSRSIELVKDAEEKYETLFCYATLKDGENSLEYYDFLVSNWFIKQPADARVLIGLDVI